MTVSHYTRYVQSMVAHGGKRASDIEWLFKSIDESLRFAQKRLIAEERKRAWCLYSTQKIYAVFYRKRWVICLINGL